MYFDVIYSLNRELIMAPLLLVVDDEPFIQEVLEVILT